MCEKSAVKDYIKKASEILQNIETEVVVAITREISRRIAKGGKILICGNGGSAADASHLAGELVGRFRIERRPVAAVALTTDPAVLTALGNDYGYRFVFQRQVEALGSSDDVLLAITTSGTSENVVLAAEKARETGMSVIAFTSGGCPSVPWADIHWKASSPETSHAQEQMLVVFHALCFGLEAVFAEKD